MSLELEQIPGLLLDSGLSKDSNPNGQSSLTEWRDDVVILRALPSSSEELPVEEEFERRKDAINLFHRELPEYTKEQQLLLLQGQKNVGINEDSTEEIEYFPVFARLTKKFRDVHPLTDMGIGEIVRDPELCKALAESNWKGIKLLLREGKILDLGFRKPNLKSPKSVVKSFVSSTKNHNLFVGYSSNGAREIFFDPDWYQDARNKGKVSTTLKALSFLGNTALYGSLSIYHNARARFSFSEKQSPFQMQQERANTLSTASGD